MEDLKLQPQQPMMRQMLQLHVDVDTQMRLWRRTFSPDVIDTAARGARGGFDYVSEARLTRG